MGGAQDETGEGAKRVSPPAGVRQRLLRLRGVASKGMARLGLFMFFVVYTGVGAKVRHKVIFFV